MRVESRVVAVSWIPSRSVRGAMRVPFEMGVSHYDAPLPDRLGDLDDWRRRDLFRVANDLSAYVDFDDETGAVRDCGYTGGGVIGSTTMGIGSAKATVEAVAYPDLQEAPEVGDGWVRFRQTAGGRTGVPAPRRVAHPPFVKYQAPTAWSTLSLTIHRDGRSELGFEGASRFPRHWVYGPDGALAAKSGQIDFRRWFRKAFGHRDPWGGGQDAPHVVGEIESAIERRLSVMIMDEGKPKMRRIKAGKVLTRQGEEVDTLYLLLDGVMQVQVDGRDVATLGPGALIGERAVLEGGRRTATLVAATPCRVAEARKVELDLELLAEVAAGHHREDDPRL